MYCRYALHTTLPYLDLFFRLFFLLTSSNPEPIYLPSPHSNKSLIHLDLQGIVFKRHKSQTVCVCSPDSKCRKLCCRKHLFPATEREIKTFSFFCGFLPSGWCSFFSTYLSVWKSSFARWYHTCYQFLKIICHSNLTWCISMEKAARKYEDLASDRVLNAPPVLRRLCSLWMEDKYYTDERLFHPS